MYIYNKYICIIKSMCFQTIKNHFFPTIILHSKRSPHKTLYKITDEI